jgi:hypothetical protein
MIEGSRSVGILHHDTRAHDIYEVSYIMYRVEWSNARTQNVCHAIRCVCVCVIGKLVVQVFYTFYRHTQYCITVIHNTMCVHPGTPF